MTHPLVGLTLRDGNKIATAVKAIRRTDLPQVELVVNFLDREIRKKVHPVHLQLLDQEGNEQLIDPTGKDFARIDTHHLVEAKSMRIIGVPRRLPSGAIVVPYEQESFADYYACKVIGGDSPLYPPGSPDLSVPLRKLKKSPALMIAIN